MLPLLLTAAATANLLLLPLPTADYCSLIRGVIL
jgi:hypothetical protein